MFHFPIGYTFFEVQDYLNIRKYKVFEGGDAVASLTENNAVEGNSGWHRVQLIGKWCTSVER